MTNFNELISKKIVSDTELERIAYTHHFFKKTIVFTNGCFDILHPGHVYYLNRARSLGDILIVGLNSDTSVKTLNKGQERPIHPERKRAEVLASLLCVDYVCLFDEPTPLHLIQKTRPNVLVKGGDYTLNKIVGADVVLSYGGKVEIVPLLEGFSTTSILNHLKQIK